MNDFEWVTEILTSGDIPIKGRAWVIGGINDTNCEEVLSFIFNNGYTWASGGTDIHRRDIRQIRQINCIFVGDVMENRITYSNRDGINSSIRIAKKHSNECGLDVYDWVDGMCVFKETIQI